MITKYLVDKNFPKDSKIVDFGCGTGILGIELAKNGFSNIVGVDGSPEMLAVAKSKQIDGKPVYRNFCVCLIGSEPLSLAETDFDIVVSSACMIKGHFPNTVFD